MQYPTAMLFHGPSARSKAVELAYQMGRLVEEPIGDEGLKIDDARRVVDLMGMANVGDKVGVVVVGPLDFARQAATDALLKTIEEFDPGYTRPVLWATDAGDVSPTIRSRCREMWCPGDLDYPEEAMDSARRILDAVVDRDRATVIEAWKDSTDHGEMLKALAKVLSFQMDDPKARELWGRVREVLRHHTPTKYEVLVALL